MVRSEKGQALLEFALVLPILIILLMGIIDFGRVSYVYMNLHLTTQETVRQGGLGKSDSDIIQFALDHFKAGNPDSLEIQITPVELYRSSGDYITVTLSYPVQYITPFLSSVLPSPHMVSTNSTLRVE